MSQIFNPNVSSGNLPPEVPLTFQADSGSAQAVGNIINVGGSFVSTNFANGIRTTAAGSTVLVNLTNRLQNTATTVAAGTQDLVTFALGTTPGVYTFDITASGFSTSLNNGVGFQIFGSARTTGIAATVIGIPDKIDNLDAALSTADFNLVASGNNLIFRATGSAASNLNWNMVAYYTFVS